MSYAGSNPVGGAKQKEYNMKKCLLVIVLPLVMLMTGCDAKKGWTTEFCYKGQKYNQFGAGGGRSVVLQLDDDGKPIKCYN